MRYTAYVIKSERSGRLYKGMTHDLVARVAAHNAGKVRSTKAFRPWILVYQEECRSLNEARKRELYLKSGFGRKFLKDMGIG